MNRTIPGSDAADAEEPAPVEESRRTGGKDGRRRARRIAAGGLVIVASIGMLASVLGVWSRRTALNSEVFARRATNAVADPRVSEELALYLTDEVMKLLDVDAIVSNTLPPAASRLIGPLDAAIRSFVQERAERLVQSDAFLNTFNDLVERAHRAAIKLLEGDTNGVFEIQGDTVVLNTIPLIADVLRAIGADGLVDRASNLPAFGGDEPPPEMITRLAQVLGVTVPPNFGQFTVMRTDSISTAQDGLKQFRHLTALLVVVTVLLIIAAIVVSPTRRRTVAELGLGLLIVMGVGWIVIRWVMDRLIDTVSGQRAPGKDPVAARDAIRAIANTFLTGLRQFTVALIVAGALIALLAFLAGRAGGPSGVVSGIRTPMIRRSAAWVTNHEDACRLIAVGIGLLLLLVAGLSTLTLLLAVVLIVAGLLAVQLFDWVATPDQVVS